MRFGTYATAGGPRLAAALSTGDLVDLHGAALALAERSTDPRDASLPALVPSDTRTFLRYGPVAREAGTRVVRWVEEQGAAVAGVHGERLVHQLDDVRLCAPVPDPEKVIGIGMNYRSHADEQSARVPKNPLVFAKWNNTLVGPRDDIRHPAISNELDYEAELGVVIGRRARAVSEGDAMSYVAGYTAANDVTARDIQLSDRQWVRGKTFDTHAPCGPFVVTLDEIEDPMSLRLRLWINDRLMQDGDSASMIFSVPFLVSFLSQSFTLEPGDLILTGTPSGVGFTREPPVFLRGGDVVRVVVDGVGEIENRVVAP